MKPLRPFTPLWGEKYFNWFVNGCLKSLAWPKNRAALEDCEWAFLTKQTDVERISNAIKDAGIKTKNLDFYLLGEEFDKNPHAAGMFVKEAFLNEAGRCITYGVQSFTAPPDTIFGDGTVSYLREIADQRDVVVLAAHARVLPTILDSVNADKPLSNANLVYTAWNNLHKTWSEAEFGLPKTNSYVGGICWRYLDENLYSVNHRLPTPYLINFTPEDMVYFKNQIHYGVIDHSWPGDVLVPMQRQRLLGSSEGAFMVEITESENNIPPLEHIKENECDLFWRNHPHNIQNRMQTLIFRGEKPLES